MIDIIFAVGIVWLVHKAENATANSDRVEKTVDDATSTDDFLAVADFDLKQKMTFPEGIPEKPQEEIQEGFSKEITMEKNDCHDTIPISASIVSMNEVMLHKLFAEFSISNAQKCIISENTNDLVVFLCKQGYSFINDFDNLYQIIKCVIESLASRSYSEDIKTFVLTHFLLHVKKTVDGRIPAKKFVAYTEKKFIEDIWLKLGIVRYDY